MLFIDILCYVKITAYLLLGVLAIVESNNIQKKREDDRKFLLSHIKERNTKLLSVSNVR